MHESVPIHSDVWMYWYVAEPGVPEGLIQLYYPLTFACKYEQYVSCQSAIECDAKDATSMHLLGQWCYSVVSVPWYQRQVASVFFATPPQSTYQEVIHTHTFGPSMIRAK